METITLHCRHCERERPADVPPKDWARLEVLLTKQGSLTVRCLRHDLVVLNTNDLQETAVYAFKLGCGLCRTGVAHSGH